MGQTQSDARARGTEGARKLALKQRKRQQQAEERKGGEPASEFADLHAPECPCCDASQWKHPHSDSTQTTAAREAIMKAMNKGDGDEVVRIFKRFKGGKLLQLKASIDVHACLTLIGNRLTRGLFGSCVDMVVLVFDVLSEAQRVDLLQHFKKFPAYKPIIHVMSDVDDTLFASKMGGSDQAFPNHHWYPGVMELLCQLSNSYVTLLTARPQGALERSLVKKMAKFGVRAHTLAGSVAGIVMEGGPSLLTVPRGKDTIMHYDRFRANKLAAAEKMAQVFPEYRFMFFGDVGQGDLAAGMQMLQSPTLAPQMIGVFIHDITRDCSRFQPLSHKRISEIATSFPQLLPTLADPKLTIFTHYPDALLKIWQVGALSSKQALKVLAAAQTTADVMKRSVTSKTPTLQVEMIAGLMGSIESMKKHIDAASVEK